MPLTDENGNPLYGGQDTTGWGWYAGNDGNLGFGPPPKAAAPTAAEKMQQYYQDVASGKQGVTDFNSLFSNENNAISSGEFGYLPTNVQQAARANPQDFVKSVLGTRNSANNDLLSIGAEGGYNTFNNASWMPGKGVQQDPNAYMSVHDSSPWSSLRDTVESAAVLAGNYFVPSSSILTSNLASKGSQKQLNSPIGKIGQLASSWGGGQMGNTLGTTVGNSGNWMDSSANIFKGLGAINSATGGSLWGGNTPSKSSGNTFGSSQNNWGGSTPNNSSGGNMANFDLGNLSLGDIGGAAAPFLSAWQNNNQKNMTKDAYDKAYGLITTPSADQQKYRSQLDTLMSNPGSMSTSPVYQAMLDSGANAVNRSAASRGMLGSGSRLADLMKSGQDTAAKYYFPQASLLTSLSGVPQDTAQRTLGANALLKRNEDTNNMNAQTLDQMLQGVGAKSWQQKLMEQYYGGGQGGSGGGSGSPTIGQIGSSIGSLLNGPGAGQVFGNTTDYGQGDWGYGTITNPGDWGNTAVDAGGFSPGDWGYGTDTNWSDWFN